MEDFYKLLGRNYNGYNKTNLLSSILAPQEDVSQDEVEYDPFQSLSLDELQPAQTNYNNDIDLSFLEGNTPQMPAQKQVATKNISGHIQEILGAREPQPKNIVNTILGARFGNDAEAAEVNPFGISDYQPEPTLQDFVSAIRQTAQGKIVGGQDVANQRYTTGIKGIAALARLGSLNKLPSDIQSYQYYSGLPPEQQKQFLQVKRNTLGTGQLFDEFGNASLVPGYSGNRGQIKIDEGRGSKIGAAQGEATGNLERQEIQAPQVLSLIQQARDILPKSTSGMVGRGMTAAANFAGKSTEASRSDKQLNVIAAALTGNVPRFEGPQGVLDVELYKQAAGDVANSSLPYEDRLAALDTMEVIQMKYVNRGAEQPFSTTSQPTGGIKFLGFE